MDTASHHRHFGPGLRRGGLRGAETQLKKIAYFVISTSAGGRACRNPARRNPRTDVSIDHFDDAPGMIFTKSAIFNAVCFLTSYKPLGDTPITR